MTDLAGSLTENLIDCIEALGGARPASKGLSELYQALAVALSEGGGGGSVASVTNSDGTLTVSPTTGLVVASASASLLASIAAKAPLASPALTGNPTAPTQSPGDNTTKIASTAFVTNAVADSTTGVSQVTNSDTTLTISPTTGAVVASLTNPLINLLWGVKHSSGGVEVGFDGTTNPPSTLVSGVRQWAGSGPPSILTSTYSNVGDLWYDSSNFADYVCTTPGLPGTAVWTESILTLASVSSIFTAAGQIIQATGSGTGGLVQLYAAAAIVPINAQTASYTAVLSDVGKLIKITSSSAVNLTINNIGWPVDSTFSFRQGGTGAITVVGGSGMTINSPGNNLVTNGQYTTSAIHFESATDGVLVGNLT